MKFMEKVWGSLGLFETVEVDEQEHEQEQKHKNDDVEPLKSKKNNNIVI